MIRKLTPANWSVRTWIVFIIMCGLIGILTGCTPERTGPTDLELCTRAVTEVATAKGFTSTQYAALFDRVCGDIE